MKVLLAVAIGVCVLAFAPADAKAKTSQNCAPVVDNRAVSLAFATGQRGAFAVARRQCQSSQIELKTANLAIQFASGARSGRASRTR